MYQTLLYITNNSIKHNAVIYTLLNYQPVLFQTIQFNISHLFAFNLNVSFIWHLHKTLSSAACPCKSWLEGESNEGLLRIPQSYRINGGSLPDCLVSYPGNSLEGILPLSRGGVSVFLLPGRLSRRLSKIKYIFLLLFKVSFNFLNCILDIPSERVLYTQ